jgi:methylated-DNA-[protein]-cysteine S-methyltransferase
MPETVYTTMPSPVGELLLTATPGGALTGLYLAPFRVQDGWRRDESTLAEVVAQLDEYFGGRRTTFDLELAPVGTSWQLRVWNALRDIPYGVTESYGGLARRLGNPGAARAVGMANGRNPISIIVPCHRVIGADGSLTGYGWGLDTKRVLLDLEAGVAARSNENGAA